MLVKSEFHFCFKFLGFGLTQCEFEIDFARVLEVCGSVRILIHVFTGIEIKSGQKWLKSFQKSEQMLPEFETLFAKVSYSILHSIV